MFSDVLNPRRAPRAPLRLSVTARDARGRWEAVTEDLGPRGCQLVAERLPPPGAEVTLRIRCQPLRRTIRAAGRVVWSQGGAPARAGVAFAAARTDAGWFGELAVADPVAGRAVASEPERLPLDEVLWLGEPPVHLPDLSPEELALLRPIGEGIAVGELRLLLGPLFDQLRGALFGLLRRRLLVLTREAAVAPGRWAGLLDAAEAALASEGRRVPRPPPPGQPAPHQARSLAQEGLAHLAAGRIEVAVARLEAARGLSPDDPMLGGLLHMLAPWRA